MMVTLTSVLCMTVRATRDRHRLEHLNRDIGLPSCFIHEVALLSTP